jgi:hypothetical protein
MGGGGRYVVECHVVLDFGTRVQSVVRVTLRSLYLRRKELLEANGRNCYTTFSMFDVIHD